MKSIDDAPPPPAWVPLQTAPPEGVQRDKSFSGAVDL